MRERASERERRRQDKRDLERRPAGRVRRTFLRRSSKYNISPSRRRAVRNIPSRCLSLRPCLAVLFLLLHLPFIDETVGFFSRILFPLDCFAFLFSLFRSLSLALTFFKARALCNPRVEHNSAQYAHCYLEAWNFLWLFAQLIIRDTARGEKHRQFGSEGNIMK